MAEGLEPINSHKKVFTIIGIIIIVAIGLYAVSVKKNQNIATPASEEVNTVNQSVSSAPISSPELSSKKWTWLRSDMSNEITTIPSKAGAFTAKFEPDGKLILMTDCNNGSSTYEVSGNSLTVGPTISTLMYCEGSSETVYFKQIQSAQSFEIENGALNIMLQGDAGTMVFN